MTVPFSLVFEVVFEGRFLSVYGKDVSNTAGLQTFLVLRRLLWSKKLRAAREPRVEAARARAATQ